MLVSHFERIIDEGSIEDLAELSDQFDKISNAISDNTSKSGVFNKKLLALLKEIVAKMEGLVESVEKQKQVADTNLVKSVKFKVIRDDQGFISEIEKEFEY